MSPFHLYPYYDETSGKIKYKLLFEDERFDTLSLLCNLQDEEGKKKLKSLLQSDYARSDGVNFASFRIDWMPFGRVRITELSNNGFIDTRKCVIDIERKELLYLFGTFDISCEEQERHDARVAAKCNVVGMDDKLYIVGRKFADMSEVMIHHALEKGYDVIGLFKEFDAGSRKGLRQVAEYYCATGGYGDDLFIDDTERLLRSMNKHATFITEKRRRITVEDIEEWGIHENFANLEDDYRVLYLVEKDKTCNSANITLLTAKTIPEDEKQDLIMKPEMPDWLRSPWIPKTRKNIVLLEKIPITEIRKSCWKEIKM